MTAIEVLNILEPIAEQGDYNTLRAIQQLKYKIENDLPNRQQKFHIGMKIRTNNPAYKSATEFIIKSGGLGIWECNIILPDGREGAYTVFEEDEMIPVETNRQQGWSEEEKQAFNEMSKEDIWRKWQSDKKILTYYMHAMAHYGVTQFADVKVVAELEMDNRKTQKGE